MEKRSLDVGIVVHTWKGIVGAQGHLVLAKELDDVLETRRIVCEGVHPETA
jgi:hypothetical protein